MFLKQAPIEVRQACPVFGGYHNVGGLEITKDEIFSAVISSLIVHTYYKLWAPHPTLYCIMGDGPSDIFHHNQLNKGELVSSIS